MKPNNPPPDKSPRLPLGLRIVLLLPLLAVAGFCAFGFLATFEPLPEAIAWRWRLGYASLLVATGAGVIKLLAKRKSE